MWVCEINFEIECAGPKQVKNIDIFMVPLIDELKLLWNGVSNTYDAHRMELFNLKAILLWTMTNFSGMLIIDLSFFDYSNIHRLRNGGLICKSSKSKLANCKFGCCVWFGYSGQKSMQCVCGQSNLHSEFTFQKTIYPSFKQFLSLAHKWRKPYFKRKFGGQFE